jgi:hypothetical protein
VGLGREVELYPDGHDCSCVRRWKLNVVVIWWRDSSFARLSVSRLLLTCMPMKMSFINRFSLVLRWLDLFVGAADRGSCDEWNVSSAMVSVVDEIEVRPGPCS